MVSGFYLSGKGIILISIFGRLIQEEMNRIAQRTILFTCLSLFFTVNACAQKSRFIYIQSDAKQPFYVTIGEKLFSSADAGYLIIPRLEEGSYDLSIGFPKKEWPRQNITCVIKEADMGYQLRNFGDKGWGLLNLQTMQAVLAKKDPVVDPEFLSELASDSFSVILASVVNDRGILKKQAVTRDTPVVVISENKAANRTQADTEEKIIATGREKGNPLVVLPAVKKLKQDTIPGGMNIRFLDISDEGADTVLIFIPVEDDVAGKADSIRPANVKAEQKKDELPSRDSKFLDMELPNPNLVRDTSAVLADSSVVAGEKAVMQNTKCKQTADNKDFLNLRRLMAAELNDGDMINTALKKFRSTCFTTEQVKNLGGLFLNEEGRYRLFVAAYPFVSDLAAFNSLEAELKEEYYIIRFRAMLNK